MSDAVTVLAELRERARQGERRAVQGLRARGADLVASASMTQSDSEASVS